MDALTFVSGKGFLMCCPGVEADVLGADICALRRVCAQDPSVRSPGHGIRLGIVVVATLQSGIGACVCSEWSPPLGLCPVRVRR